MPQLKTGRSTQPTTRKKGALLVPLALGGAALAAVAGFWWWRKRAQAAPGPGPGPGPGPLLLPDPGGPTIT